MTSISRSLSTPPALLLKNNTAPVQQKGTGGIRPVWVRPGANVPADLRSRMESSYRGASEMMSESYEKTEHFGGRVRSMSDLLAIAPK